MKHFFVAVLAVSLVVLCAGTAMGMPNPPGATDIDTWYSIEDEEPFFSGGLVNVPDSSVSVFTGEYYRNDFFFLTGYYADNPASGMSEVTGSYLFDSGFFVALDVVNYPGGTYYSIYPGYCRAWDDRGHLAFSLDYDSEYGLVGLEVDLKYRADALMIRGELDVYDDDNYVLEASMAYRVGEALTVGGDLEFEDGSLEDFAAGATWRPGSWVFDLRIDEDWDYDLSGVYYFGHFGLGLEYCGNVHRLKAKYDTDDSRLAVFFTPEQDSAWVSMNYEFVYTRFF